MLAEPTKEYCNSPENVSHVLSSCLPTNLNSHWQVFLLFPSNESMQVHINFFDKFCETMTQK